MSKVEHDESVMIFVDGNYVYKCLEAVKKEFGAKELIGLLDKICVKLPGENDLRRIYYYNSYPPLESDKKRKESAYKLIWQIENKTKLSLAEVQKKIGSLFAKHTSQETVTKELGITQEEFKAQQMDFESRRQMRFYESLQYNGLKVILKNLKKDDKGNYYQKGVDIYIATDMLSLAFEDGYDTAVLVSGDADFIEVVDKIQEKGKLVVLACFERGKSWELQRICDGFIGLDEFLVDKTEEKAKESKIK